MMINKYEKGSKETRKNRRVESGQEEYVASHFPIFTELEQPPVVRIESIAPKNL